MEQWASNRPIRLSPAYDRHVELGAEFFEAAGWERPVLVRHERAAARRVRRPGHAARGRVGVALVVADHQRRAPRDARPGRPGRPVGVRDLRRHRAGRASPPSSGSASTRSTSRPGGRSTRRSSTAAGGILADLTIMRLAARPLPRRDRRRHGHARPEDLPGRAARPTARPSSTTLTNAYTTFGLWGPRARDILGAARDGRTDISHAGFPFLTSKSVDIDGVRTLASRISYVGELGWEIYVPIEQGLRVWDALWRAGQPHGLVAGRDRHVRGHVAAREGLPRPRRRARARLRPRRGGHGPADAEGRRLRRQGGLRAAAARPIRPRSCAR